MSIEKTYGDTIDDIQDALMECSQEDLKDVYKKLMGKEPDSSELISDILEHLGEVDEDYFSEVYSSIVNKKCEFNYDSLIFVIED